MERLDVICQAANDLAARHSHLGTSEPAGARVQHLCAALGLFLLPVKRESVMLGGAHARLQLCFWDQPERGGMLWISDDLPAERQAFAIAHELGHFALHRGEGIALHPPCDETQVSERADPAELRVQSHRVEEYTPRARRELEANAFAAELLAPRAEVRRRFATSDVWDAARLAAHFGISPLLAHRRLVDAVLAPSPLATPSQPAATASTTPGNDAIAGAQALLANLDPGQRDAARVEGPALVVAGPGTGKTATLTGRVAHLVAERGVPPERVLALTFSNRAAGEMRQRLSDAHLPGERMPVMTIHAFAATLLREYAPRVPCAPGERLASDFRILDEADAFLLMEELLAELPLRHYRSLGNPTRHLRTLLADFSQARDALLTPAAYLALVNAMPPAPAPTSDASAAAPTPRKGKAERPRAPAGTFTREHIEKARERALAYGVWDRALRRRGLVDFGGLIVRAVELLRADAEVLAHVRWRYPEVLVDEFQDTNRAAGELLLLLAGEAGRGLWVVGDRNQSIYRWRGASPSNLSRLAERYPALRVRTLRRCYRSVPAIVAMGSAAAARMAELSVPPRPGGGSEDAAAAHPSPDAPALVEALRPVALEAVRGVEPRPPVLRGDAFITETQEHAGLAHAIRVRRAQGVAYRDQAVLCRTHTQERRIAETLAAAELPVGQVGGFFQRPEVKDALALVALAAGPDARGLLRGQALLAGLGGPVPPGTTLAAVARALAAARRPLPTALADPTTLAGVDGLPPAQRAMLHRLGTVAAQMRDAQGVGDELASFLLRPGGYAWRLLRVASSLDAPAMAQNGTAGASREPIAARRTPGRSRAALAALGELVRLAQRFDSRWSREEDFRARLSRAVTHRKRPMSGRDDAAAGGERGPDAETAVAASGQPAIDAAVTENQQIATAPAVRCFMHYLGALRAAEVSVPVPAGEDDAVQVMTLHASKGLEFPIVYVPGLVQGLFPHTSTTHDDPCPPGFRESDAPGEREAEERCLFYVGMTRARDVVMLTRPASRGRTSSGAPRAPQPSPLLALLDGSADWSDAPPLLSDEELAALPVEAQGPDGAAGDEDEDEDGERDAASPILGADHSRGTGAAGRAFTLHDLEQYIECPRQYKYARLYNLLDPADDAVYRFHRYVRHGMRTLRDLHAEAPQAAWEAAEARLRAHWETDGPAGHAYDAFYWQHAQAILHEEWRALAAEPAASVAPVTTLAQPLRARLAGCAVDVVADRVIRVPESGDGMVSGMADATVLVRLHTGRPNDQDKDDLRLPLYYLAQQQRDRGAAVRVEIAYAGGGLASADVDPEAGESPRGDVVDVTDVARRAAEKYEKPDRRQRSKLDKLDEAAAGIAAGLFPPRPNERRCAACPYCYVCPADPAEDETGEA